MTSHDRTIIEIQQSMIAIQGETIETLQETLNLMATFTALVSIVFLVLIARIVL